MFTTMFLQTQTAADLARVAWLAEHCAWIAGAILLLTAAIWFMERRPTVKRVVLTGLSTATAMWLTDWKWSGWAFWW